MRRGKGSQAPSIPEKLRPILEAIRLSPSAHNTQPWRLFIVGDDRLRVGWEPASWLDTADPECEQLGYSLGCAVEAASSVAHIEYDPAPETDLMSGTGTIGEIHLKAASETETEEALALLRARRTNRAPFRAEAPERSLIKTLEGLGSDLGTRLSFLSRHDQIRDLAELTAKGAEACLLDPAYLEELLKWLRTTTREWDWDADGLSPESLMMDAATVRLVRWLKRSRWGRVLIPRLGMAKLMGLQAARAVRTSGALALVTTNDPTVQGRIAGGRSLMRLWLAATRMGLALQPVHFPLCNDRLRSSTLQLFGREAGEHAVTVVRLGHETRSAPASSRLPLERICTVVPGDPTP